MSYLVLEIEAEQLVADERLKASLASPEVRLSGGR